jgi:Acetate kinase
MIVLFDPEPPLVRWCIVNNDIITEHVCAFETDWLNNVQKEIKKYKPLEAIGYLLYHGGEEIKNPLTLFSSQFLPHIERCIRFLPEYNELILRIVKECYTMMSDIHHIILCDTAFFLNLPMEARIYAVPEELRKRGIRRYGGFGLSHQWAWEQVLLLNESAKRMISIFLGDHTNISAIKDGQVVETSIGFTPVEGVISSNSCGDIDPTIVFQLVSSGMSLKEINNLLSREGGFTGLLGEFTSLSDILKNSSDNPDLSLARDIFIHQVKKYIGAYISVLGGIDILTFMTDKIEETRDLILQICRSLEFIGLKCRTNEDQDFKILSDDGSPIKAYCLKYNKWNVLTEKITNFIK